MGKVSWQRAVIKVGSALVSPNGEGCSTEFLQAIVDFIVAAHRQNKHVILVSSGSIAAARSRIKTGLRATIAEKQAMAALGQMKMMANWSSMFSQHDRHRENKPIECAQMLLTVEDLADRRRYVNIKNTLEQLLENNIIPIVNENDTVAVDEIKVGDNDNLAAHMAIASQADCLIICTDVNGLYTANPRTSPDATLIQEVAHIDKKTMALAGGAGTDVGTGGMITKLQAAKKCSQSGISTLLINGTDAQSFVQLSKGICSGTTFLPDTKGKGARHDWLSHTSSVKGQIDIDKGALNASSGKAASLLAVGLTNVTGKFNAGDAVEITHAGELIGKGLCNYNSTELLRIKGCKSDQIIDILNYTAGETVVHRDNLVLHY
jgi:glutamate 5-kinase